jgi:hypothetical protein
MATLTCETTLKVTGADLEQLLTEEFCRSYNLLGALKVTAIRPVEGGDFELTLTPREPEPAPEPKLQAVS